MQAHCCTFKSLLYMCQRSAEAYIFISACLSICLYYFFLIFNVSFINLLILSLLSMSKMVGDENL